VTPKKADQKRGRDGNQRRTTDHDANLASFAKTKEKAAPFGTAFYFLDD
jgi:hypothetical protein